MKFFTVLYMMPVAGLDAWMGTPAHAPMTIRNWNTTTKLLELLNK